MPTAPVILILVAAAAVGVYLLTLWLKGERPMVAVGAHILLGVGGAEALVAFLHGSGLSEDDPVRATGKLALGLLAAAIFTGFAAPLLFKNSRQLANAIVAAHACAGLAAVFVALSFFAKL